MSRKLILLLCSCFLIATVVVVTLYAANYKIVHERGGFLREYEKKFVRKTAEMEIGFSSWYFAGATADSIYFGNVTAPFHILMVDKALSGSQRVKIRLKDLENASVYQSARVSVDLPYFYLADGYQPALYRGRIGEWIAEPFDWDTRVYFQKFVPITPTSFAIRSNSVRSRENILGKVQVDSPRVKLNDKLLQKQVDGIFCTDGLLMHNKDINKLVYSYYYRNEFLVCDTNLNLEYRGHSLDTFTKAQLKIGHINSDQIDKLLEKRTINSKSATYSNYLFLKSNVLAKNDKDVALRHAALIDVYNLLTKRYAFSFSIPNYRYSTDNVPMREFLVTDSALYALYEKQLVKFDLRKAVHLLADR